jgi:hypothetical protein
MLDPCFKSLQTITNFVGFESTMEIIIEFNRKVLLGKNTIKEATQVSGHS